MQATIITDRPLASYGQTLSFRNKKTRSGNEHFILQIMNPDRVVKAGGLYVGLTSWWDPPSLVFYCCNNVAGYLLLGLNENTPP